jgi:uncharacterized protein (TIGR00297 family)
VTNATAGFLLAALISGLAWRARSLTLGGAISATIIGTLAVAAGWAWGLLLILYFISSTALSRVGRARKERRMSSVVAKGGERDAVQVLANGALFGGAALAMLIAPHARWIALGAGALAASAADTWATEIGTLSRRDPRFILNGTTVPAGTSGAVSLEGTLAMFASAVFIGVVMITLGWTSTLAIRVTLAGVFGAIVDTLLGATVQARRWCDACARETERSTHDCGCETRRLRGLGWLDNDLVNFLSGLAGGLLAALLSR